MGKIIHVDFKKAREERELDRLLFEDIYIDHIKYSKTPGVVRNIDRYGFDKLIFGDEEF